MDAKLLTLRLFFLAGAIGLTMQPVAAQRSTADSEPMVDLDQPTFVGSAMQEKVARCRTVMSARAKPSRAQTFSRASQDRAILSLKSAGCEVTPLSLQPVSGPNNPQDPYPGCFITWGTAQFPGWVIVCPGAGTWVNVWPY